MYISQYPQDWRDQYDLKHDAGVLDPNVSLVTITEFMQKIWDHKQRKKRRYVKHRSIKKRKKVTSNHTDVGTYVIVVATVVVIAVIVVLLALQVATLAVV